MGRLHWRAGDDGPGEWYAWDDESDPRVDEPRWLVKMTEDGTWAGWEYDEDGSRTCITNDHVTVGGAQAEIDEATRPEEPESHYDRALRMCAAHYEWEARARGRVGQ